MKSRIREVRNNLKLSQEEFAENLGLSRNFIWQIEKGDRQPSDRTISDICRIYNVNEDWLRNGSGNMYLARNRSQILTDYVSECMKKPDSFKARFTEGMAKLTEDQWEQIASIVNTIFDQKK